MRSFVCLLALTGCAVEVQLDDGLHTPGDGVDAAGLLDSPQHVADPGPETARGSFVPLGSAWPDSRGAALHDTLRSGVIGAFDNTCEVDEAGDLGTEFDPGPGDETIEDGDDGNSISLRSLTSTENGLAITTYFEGYPRVDATLAQADVAAARFTPSGVVAAIDLAGDCDVRFYDDTFRLEARERVPGACSDLSVGLDGDVVVAAGGRAFLVEADASFDLGAADQVQVLGSVVATTVDNGRSVVVRDLDGSWAWEAQVAFPVVDMTRAGSDLVFATPEFLTAYGEDGTLLASSEHFNGVVSVHGSGGSFLGVVTAFGLDLYELE